MSETVATVFKILQPCNTFHNSHLCKNKLLTKHLYLINVVDLILVSLLQWYNAEIWERVNTFLSLHLERWSLDRLCTWLSTCCSSSQCTSANHFWWQRADQPEIGCTPCRGSTRCASVGCHMTDPGDKTEERVGKCFV